MMGIRIIVLFLSVLICTNIFFLLSFIPTIQAQAQSSDRVCSATSCNRTGSCTETTALSATWTTFWRRQREQRWNAGHAAQTQQPLWNHERLSMDLLVLQHPSSSNSKQCVCVINQRVPFWTRTKQPPLSPANRLSSWEKQIIMLN